MKKLILLLTLSISLISSANAQEWEYLPNTDDFEITGTFEFQGQNYVFNDYSLWYFDKVKDEWVYSLGNLIEKTEYFTVANIFYDDENLLITNGFGQFIKSSDGKNWSEGITPNLVFDNKFITIIGLLKGNLIGVSQDNSNQNKLNFYKSSDFGQNFSKFTSKDLDHPIFPRFINISSNNDHIIFHEDLLPKELFKINSDLTIEQIALPEGKTWYSFNNVDSKNGKIIIPHYSGGEVVFEYYDGSKWESKNFIDTVEDYRAVRGFFIEDNFYLISYVNSGKQRISIYDLNFNLITHYPFPENIVATNILSISKLTGEYLIFSKEKHHFRTKDFLTFQFFTKKLSTKNDVQLVSQGLDLFINNSDGIFRTKDGFNFKKIVPDSFNSRYSKDKIFAYGKDKLLYFQGSSTGYFISNNNGANWKQYSFSNYSIYDFYQANNRYFFFYDTREDVFFRLDIETRKTVKTNFDFRLENYHEVEFFGEQETIFMTVYNYLYKSIDGGINWFKEDLSKYADETSPNNYSFKLLQFSKRLFLYAKQKGEIKLFEWKNYNFNEIIAENTHEMIRNSAGAYIVEYNSGLACVTHKTWHYLEDNTTRWIEQNNTNYQGEFYIKSITPTRFGLALANEYRGSWFYKEQVVNVISNEIEALTVYPNPNKGQGIIETPIGVQGKLEIINIKGQSVFSKQIEEGENHFNISNPVSGVYFIRLTNDNGVMKFNGKLLVED